MATDEEKARGINNSRRRGRTNNAKRLDMFAKRVGSKEQADWGDVHPDLLSSVVQHAVRIGGAVTFGLSRDGGAYMLTLLLDGDRATMWISGSDDVEAELREVIDKLDALTED